MSLKHWFPGLCLVLMIVSEVFLFRANHERELAQNNLTSVQGELDRVQGDLAALKGSNSSAQSTEMARLRRLNEILNDKCAALQRKLTAQQAELQQLKQDSEQTAQHLTTARTALQMQQEHLQEMQADKQRADQETCLENLRLIDAAKQQWAIDKNADANATPTTEDLAAYFKSGVFPVCPSGGTYTINAMTLPPACSYPGHVLPPPPPAGGQMVPQSQ